VNDPTAAMSAPDELPRLDESFPRQYDARAKGELDRDDLLYFPGRPGLVVEVQPKAAAGWTGVFGADSPGFLSGIFTTPDEHSELHGVRGIAWTSSRSTCDSKLRGEVRGLGGTT
jgi:hypothetical protein